jgi:HEAT repeat protein
VSFKKTYLGLLLGLILAATGAMDTYAQEKTDSMPTDSTVMDTTMTMQEPVEVLSVYDRRILNRFEKSPLMVTILYIIILYSIITLITLLIIILLNRTRLQRKGVLTEYLLARYQLLLMNYLFDEEQQELAFLELNEVADNRINRQVLIDQMIDLSVNLKGEIKEDIQKLYLRLGLKRDSLEKAYSRKWHQNVKGFRELAFMNIPDANEQIIKSLNASNEILRMEAQIAMVRLSDGNPYEFLHMLKKPLSLWEQVTMHELQIQHNLVVPDFKQWLSSENISVVMFALEMVSWYKQRGVGKELIELFEHENEQVRNIAFKVCGEIGLKMVFPALVHRYPEEIFKNKLEILHAFVKMPDEKYLNFLKSVLDTEDDVQLQIEATKAMENTGEPGISMLIKLMKTKSEYKNYQIIIRHVLDGRIY